MKGKRVHPKIRDRAKALYTEEGYSPEEIIDQLSLEVLDHQLEISDRPSDDIELPKDRSTINRWAKEYGWSPTWREARKRHQAAIEAGDPFTISGITDPIFHLARVKALRRAEELAREHPEVDDDLIAEAVILRVEWEVEPGRRTIRELRPLIRQAIERVRKRSESMSNYQYRPMTLEELEEHEEVILASQGVVLTYTASTDDESPYFIEDIPHADEGSDSP